MKNDAVRLVVVSDRALSRTALAGALGAAANCVITEQLDNLGDALAYCDREGADALVVDVQTASRDISGSDTPICELAMRGLSSECATEIANLHHDVMVPPWRVDTADVGELSARERQVFLLLSAGLSNRQLSGRLAVTERTVKDHVGRVMAKLGFESRLQAGLAALVYVAECERRRA